MKGCETILINVPKPLTGKLLAHFLQCIQFNMHMVEGAFSNRLIAPDSETRIWKNASKFCIGEFVETTPLGGSVYPTLANVNHSCDPNLTLISFGKRTVAFATRKIKAGDELHDSYGAVYFHMDKNERQQFLQVGTLLKRDLPLKGSRLLPFL